MKIWIFLSALFISVCFDDVVYLLVEVFFVNFFGVWIVVMAIRNFFLFNHLNCAFDYYLNG